MKIKKSRHYYCTWFHISKSLFFTPSFLVRIDILTCFCLVRYEEQLSASLEREKNLETMRAQMELEWQRCRENMKTEYYHVNKQLIKELTQNKNQVSLKWKQKHFFDDVTFLIMKIKMVVVRSPLGQRKGGEERASTCTTLN